MAFGSNKIKDLNPIELEREGSDQVKNITLNVKIQNIIHYNKESGFFVLSATFSGKVAPRIIVNGKMYFSKEIIVTGVSPTLGDNERKGQLIDCTGQWVEDFKYGIQFKSLFINEQLPESPAALRKFLSDGRIKGIGKKTADKLVDEWGMKAFDILKGNPEELVKIPGITNEKAHDICKQWNEKLNVYSIVSYLGLHNISESSALKVYEYYKSKNPNINCVELVKQRPYDLIKIEGIGFKTADTLALSLGVDFNDIIRLRAALFYELEEKTKRVGDSAIPLNEWVESSINDLGVTKEDVVKVCQELITKKQVIIRNIKVSKVNKYGNNSITETVMQCVSPAKEAIIERDIAKELKRIFDNSIKFDEEDNELIKKEIYDPKKKLDISQIKAIWNSLTTNSISLMTGGPGTGKTTTLKAMVYIAEKLGAKVIISAPTGKATKRMEESIRRPAKTIHRRLKFSGKGSFEFNEHNPLEGDVFIIDEMSMVDNSLFLSFLKAVPDGASLILVGDSDQLPSVGIGNVLNDLKKSNIILESKLNVIHRTDKESAQIPLNAKLINEGKIPSLTGDIEKDSYVFINSETDEEIVDNMVKSIEYLLNNGYKPEDIQVLTPQKNGVSGVEALNKTLKPLLKNKKIINKVIAKNPLEAQDEDAPVDLGDKLMQIKNDYELEVYNGDMGYVEKIDNTNKKFFLRMDMDNIVEIPFNKNKELVLGYAITIHKSQGSETPVVIIPLSRSHLYSMNKNLIYTGVTRGKKKVIVLSDQRTLSIGVSKINNINRITGLKEHIKQICGNIKYDLLPLPENPYKEN